MGIPAQKSMVAGSAAASTAAAGRSASADPLDVDAEGQEMVDNMIGWMLGLLGGRRRKKAT